MNGVDPLKLLGVSRNYTLEELKERFKKSSLIWHPDIPNTGNAEIFKLVVQSYKTLLEQYNVKKGDKQYGELKAEYKKSTHNNNVNKFDGFRDPTEINARFNLNKFNDIFDKNKLDDINDVGYKEWLENNPDTSEECSIKYNKKFTNSGFNDHFEKNVNNSDSKSKHLIKFIEPEALCTAKNIQFTNLGEDNIDDFSGENKSLRDLNYMDLKIAYTTSRIIDPSTVDPRKQYNSVDQLEKDRSKVKYEMSPEDMRRNEIKRQKEQFLEKKRLENLIQYDQRISEHHAKVNSLLLHNRLA